MSRPDVYKSQVRDVAFGARVKIVEPVNLYECRIGDDCFIGPFVEIQKGVVVGQPHPHPVAFDDLRTRRDRR